MPELPEVETIARTLAPYVQGRRLRAIEIHERRLREPIAADFEGRLAGRVVRGVGRRGKALVVDVGGGEVLLVQLGMTGRLTLRSADAPARPHDHVRFVLDDGGRLVFNDVRRFGWLRVVSAADVAVLVGGGADPMDDAFTAQCLFGLTRRRRTSVKSLLMDQRIVVGIGNIYANEALFHAGVRPRRGAGRLTAAECARIVDAVRCVLYDAIRCGGSSISDYRDGFDRFGSYQERHHVYARAGSPCRACGTPIVGCRVVGRSTFYCRRCQR